MTIFSAQKSFLVLAQGSLKTWGGVRSCLDYTHLAVVQVLHYPYLNLKTCKKFCEYPPPLVC